MAAPQSDRLPRLCMMGCRGRLTRAIGSILASYVSLVAHRLIVLPLSLFAKKEMEMQFSKDRVKDSHEPPPMV